jgi:UrcA family protein
MLKIILTTALLATAAPALAQPDGDMHQVHVSSRDLDLRRSADVHQLDLRLHAALKAVCPDNAWDSFEVKRCREVAGADVARQRARLITTARAADRLASIAADR